MTAHLTPYIMLNGNAGEAIHYYTEVLHAEVLFSQTFGEGEHPDNPLSQQDQERIAHAVLRVGASELMVADGMPDQLQQQGDLVNICMTFNDAEEARSYYDALKADGKVNIPLQEFYFSPAYGMITDKFGVCFQIFTKHSH